MNDRGTFITVASPWGGALYSDTSFRYRTLYFWASASASHCSVSRPDRVVRIGRLSTDREPPCAIGHGPVWTQRRAGERTSRERRPSALSDSSTKGAAQRVTSCAMPRTPRVSERAARARRRLIASAACARCARRRHARSHAIASRGSTPRVCQRAADYLPASACATASGHRRCDPFAVYARCCPSLKLTTHHPAGRNAGADAQSPTSRTLRPRSSTLVRRGCAKYSPASICAATARFGECELYARSLAAASLSTSSRSVARS